MSESKPVKINISEIVKSPYYRGAIANEIESIKHSFNHRPKPKPGFKYRRSAFESFSDKELQPEFLCTEILKIWEKKSNLSSQKRQFIQSVSNRVLKKVLRDIDEYNEKITNPE